MKKTILCLLTLLALAPVLNAQGRRGLRINEVMVKNDSSMIDDFGRHSAWIELFNSTFAPLEISSVYLTNDSTDKRKYPVPIGDVNTEIPTRQHVVFWADGKPNDGTFHLNFTLTPGVDNWIGLYDADGLSLIDEVIIPASLLPDQSYARKADGSDEGWEIRDGSPESYVTPGSNNVIHDVNGKVEMFRENDEHGFALSIMAMCIVFGALLLLAISFYILNKIGAYILGRNKIMAHGKTTAETRAEGNSIGSHADSGEVIAAISMALNEHLDAHDRENTILTINKVRRAYSPWSSKLYGMRQMPDRKR